MRGMLVPEEHAEIMRKAQAEKSFTQGMVLGAFFAGLFAVLLVVV